MVIKQHETFYFNDESLVILIKSLQISRCPTLGTGWIRKWTTTIAASTEKNYSMKTFWAAWKCGSLENRLLLYKINYILQTWLELDIFHKNQSAFFFSMPFLNFMNFMSTLAKLAGIFLFSAGFTSLLRAEKLRSASSLPDPVWSRWYFSKAEKALFANSAMGANVSRFL